MKQELRTRPFPALTPAQRYHFDVYGYVIVPDVLTRQECEVMRSDLQRLKKDLLAIDPPENRVIEHAYFQTDSPHHHYLGAIGQAWSYPGILDYVTHPKIVGMAEEVSGGKVHILEANAHINRMAPEWDLDGSGFPKYGFHRGLPVDEGSHYKNGLVHANFVKVLTNLTDLGPDDGGTVVIPGSHKTDAGDEAIVAAAYEDRSLISQIVAPAGSAVLFTEALLHATGRITSDNERVIIITGYGTTYFPWQFMESHRSDFRIEDAFIESIPESLRDLYVSEGYIQRKHRYRDLSQVADGKSYPATPWPALEERRKS
ncbi:MAG: hypothetical protein HOH43_23655 [Candidatus Latescibacteria bacterium]|jgi:hypothetical protein|nr:hypothetical protein [Candidatus Latescibacterota bacterium]